jgi:hypothetical protein
LQDEIFDKATDSVIGESGGDSGAEPKASPQATRHVVLATTLQYLKAAGCVDASFAGIEAQHDLAKAEAIPSTSGIGNQNRIHKNKSTVH